VTPSTSDCLCSILSTSSSKPAVRLTKESLESVSNIPITSRISDTKDDPSNATILARCHADKAAACVICGARSVVDMTDDELDTWMGAWTRAVNVKEALDLIEKAALEACFEENKLVAVKRCGISK
jgi:hypothetical protein